MFSRTIKTICLLLVAALLFNMLPVQSFALGSIESNQQATLVEDAPLEILAEVEEKRTEYSKEYILSNGLHMAQLYASAVHYEENGQWKEIDNTLKTSGIGKNGVLTNTQGPWQVSFPQIMGSGSAVSVTKDGYTLSFSLAGKLSASSGAELMSAQAETYALTAGKSTVGIVEQIDLTAAKESVQFPETVPDKLHSRVAYNSIYDNTNIVYDLQSNRVKESIILGRYDSTLRGYRYTLNTGKLIPVLSADGHIDFYDENRENIVLVMPAPFLVDADNAYNYDINVTLTGSGGSYTLSYILPQSWLADSSRAWPVVLDPIILPSMNTNNIRDRSVGSKYDPSQTASTLDVGLFQGTGKTRIFLKYANLPVLTSADVVVYAEINLHKTSNQSKSAPIEVHKVLGDWDSSTVTWQTQPDYNETVEDYVTAQASGLYAWDVTDIARQWYATGNNYGMMFKVPNSIENSTTETNTKEFWSSDYSYYVAPTLYIYFSNTNGLEGYWDYASASAGRAGTGYVNTYTGNLVWTREHMGFGGSRMPVTISHTYNANDSTVPSNSNTATGTSGNYFDMGYGWRTNIHQRVYAWGNYYVWEDADGTDHFFYWNGTTYEDEDDSSRTLVRKENGDIETSVITQKDGTKLYFDGWGRLRKIENNQDTKSTIWVDYLYNPGCWPSKVTDGAGREYRFSYNGYVLNRISYYGTGTTELDWVTFGYTDGNLTTITDKEGNVSTFTYNGHILTGVTEDRDDTNSYRLEYAYHPVTSAFQPYRVASVTEYDGEAKGSKLSFSYGDNHTVLEDSLQNKQILQFNNFGNVIAVQDEEGHAQYGTYAKNTRNDAGKGNQLTLSSKLQNTVSNMLRDHSFENASRWYYSGVADGWPEVVSTTAYLGNKSLQIPGGRTVIQDQVTLEAGKTYTFSAFVKTDAATTAKLSIGSEYSQHLPASSDWTRLQVSYTNQSAEAQQVTLALITEGTGYVYMDCVQLEQTATASRYNLIENGDFGFTNTDASAYGWTGTGLAATDGLSTLAPDAPQLSSDVFAITGDFYTQKHLSQRVEVSGQEGDSFVLSGWGKGDSVALRTENGNARTFGLKLTFHYLTEVENDAPVTVSFSPETDSGEYWQYISTPAAARAAFDYVTVELLYDYNANTAYFDGIQLYKEPFGVSYDYDPETGNLISVVDLQKQRTEYQYNTNNDLTAIILNGDTEMTYTYDNWRNVQTATTKEGLEYTFTYDTYGNNTSVSITDGTKTVTSSAEYTDDGNQIATTTDALGNVTEYGYDLNTGVLNWVKYPEDTNATRTNYTYDDMYRMATAATTMDTDLALSAVYGYTTDGLLSTIQTPSTTYTFSYGTFDLRSSVMVGTKTLASYTYDTNYRLTRLDYGNQDNVQYTYDGLSRIIRETYENGDYVAYTYDNDGNLATVFDSATGITTTYYYDLLGRALYYTKADATGQIQSVQYAYDVKNNLTGLTETVGNSTQGYVYEYDDDNRIIKVTLGNISVSYTYDDFGRLIEKVTTQGETEVKTETYTFVDRAVETDEGEKTYTATQIAEYRVVTDGSDITYLYTYDKNGNILTIGEKENNITKTISYVYDSANQLVRENNQAGGYTHAWTYDDAGNIKFRKEYTYTTVESLANVTPNKTVAYDYNDETWGDLLTSYDNQQIEYDGIGNPEEWGNRTFTWQRGRQLASLTENGTTWTYTYDANGMRTSRTGDGKTYTYTYNGSQLVQMTVDGNTLRFTYDAAGTPLTVTYDGDTYYYVTNIQGDVVAIVDASGTKLVEYAYSSWGVVLQAEGVAEGENEALADALAELNPLRYRGYVYDAETALYYLQSRYYNPMVGRFINADAYTTTGQSLLGNNMFTYCCNSPVVRLDSHGEFFLSAISASVAELIVAAAIVVAVFVFADIIVRNPPTFPQVSIVPQQSIAALDTKAETAEVATSTKKTPRDPVHHIVAQSDHRATESRQILKDVGIDPVTDPMNLVVLPQQYHASLHTTAYHNYVTERLRPVAGDRIGVEATLFLLKMEIVARSLFGIRWD